MFYVVLDVRFAAGEEQNSSRLVVSVLSRQMQSRTTGLNVCIANIRRSIITINKAIIDSRLRPRCATTTTCNCRSLSLSKIWYKSMQQIRVLCCRRLGIRIRATCENTTSSTIPEVHNVSQRHPRMTEHAQKI